MYYDNYTPIAIGSFDNIPYNEKITYTVTIYQKDAGKTVIPFSITFGANPLIIRTLNDEAFGIKGKEAELNILNINNTTPLNKFYSEEDDTYKIKIEATNTIPTTSIIFWGYLVQEDSSEVLNDFTHELKLRFTDNLGSLKYVNFFDASRWSPVSSTYLRINNPMAEIVAEGTTTSQYFSLYSNLTTGNPIVGDYVVLLQSPIGNASFEIKKIETIAGVKRLYFTDNLLTFAPATCKIAYLTGNNASGRIKLADVLRICLHATNLNLDVYFGNSITAYKSPTNYTDILNNIYIDGRSLMQDENNWKDCYQILNDFLVRFQCSIFQQDGSWYIVRWNELRYHNNQIPFIQYDGYFNQLSNIYYFAQVGDLFEEGVDETYLRPYNFYKETFNFKYNSNLLYNKNGIKLGLKINEYATTFEGQLATAYEYDWDGWVTNPAATNTYQPFIRITKSLIDVELERLIGLRYLSGAAPNVLQAAAIIPQTFECKQGDKLKFSFEFKSSSTQTNRTYTFRFQISKGPNAGDKRYLEDSDYSWSTSSNAFTYGTGAAGTSDWLKLDIETKPFPFDGVFTMYLFEVSENGGETLFRNITIEYIPFIAKLNITTGQENKNIQNKIVKNNQSQEIFYDDTLSNILSGCLFFNSYTNLVQDITLSNMSGWRDGQVSIPWSLGQIMTTQMEDWKYKLRLKLEGKILGIVNQVGDTWSLHKAIIFPVKSGKYFIFGKVSYNCKEDTIEFTMYEMWDNTESRATVGIQGNNKISYQFKYLYK